mmetsp:Transcript_98310/g.225714  ORF Transcript_98310/g.225714 Transcript_98310/m.225714 type:complete len:172 (+) Transcript_98310:279-794(+)
MLDGVAAVADQFFSTAQILVQLPQEIEDVVPREAAVAAELLLKVWIRRWPQCRTWRQFVQATFDGCSAPGLWQSLTRDEQSQTAEVLSASYDVSLLCLLKMRKFFGAARGGEPAGDTRRWLRDLIPSGMLRWLPQTKVHLERWFHDDDLEAESEESEAELDYTTATDPHAA